MDEAELLIEEAESKLGFAKIFYESSRYGDAVSRAYYSMHYAARALLSTKNIFPKTHKGKQGEGRLRRRVRVHGRRCGGHNRIC